MALKLLCIVAHPDDECFAFGGALALAADRGIETSVLCLTDGQAASFRGDARSGEELGQMRRAEFAASCAILGVHHYELLDYQDAQLESVDFSQTTGRLVERIRRGCPDVILTFAPDGALNTHPDHTMVSLLTTAAFHWSGRERRYLGLGEPFQPRRLFYQSTEYFLPDRLPPLPAPWSVRLDISAVKDRKLRAFRAHTSQAPLIERTRDVFEKHGGTEVYTLAATVDPGPARLATDLFDGLAEA